MTIMRTCGSIFPPCGLDFWRDLYDKWVHFHLRKVCLFLLFFFMFPYILFWPFLFYRDFYYTIASYHTPNFFTTFFVQERKVTFPWDHVLRILYPSYLLYPTFLIIPLDFENLINIDLHNEFSNIFSYNISEMANLLVGPCHRYCIGALHLSASISCRCLTNIVSAIIHLHSHASLVTLLRSFSVLSSIMIL